MTDATPVGMRLWTVGYNAYYAESDHLLRDEAAARALDDTGVREAVAKSTVGSKGHDCPFCKAALTALTGTKEEVSDEKEV